ncbi:MAG: glycoside hydrolase family 5 protein [Ruminococcus sp.]
MNLWKKLMTCTLAAAMACSVAGCGGEESPDSSTSGADAPAVQNDGTFTIGVNEVAEAMGAGWNLGNQLEAASGGTPSETAWGNPVITQELISAVADAGFTTIRVPVSYLSKIDDANGYAVDTAWLDRVEEVVQYCYTENLYVIINMHGDGYNTIDGGWMLVNGEDQETICEKYEAVWKQIAERFKDYDEHLIFESMNEEFDGTYNDPNPDYYANLNKYNQIFVDTVRASGGNNTHRYLLVPGWNTNIQYTVGDYGFVMPTDEQCTAGENRLMLSVHYYDPWDYCGEENMKTYVWGSKGDALIASGISATSQAKWGLEDYLDERFQSLYDAYVSKNIPVIIGEYGCIDKSTANADRSGDIQSCRAYFNGYVAGKAASLGMIPVYWDNGVNSLYGFGVFDRSTYEQTQPEIISTIIEAVKNKDPQAGADVTIESKLEKSSEVHAYIGIQTEVYTFRNAYNDASYGASTEYFNTLIKWSEENEIIDTGATFTDAAITGDGTYSVSVSGYDFSQDSSKLNMLFISTDFTYFSNMHVTDVVLKCDDTEIPIAKPIVMADAQGNLYVELVNIYNTDLAPLDYTMPTDSFTITFTISGMNNVLQ